MTCYFAPIVGLRFSSSSLSGIGLALKFLRAASQALRQQAKPLANHAIDNAFG
jgi:hypothetical protein